MYRTAHCFRRTKTTISLLPCQVVGDSLRVFGKIPELRVMCKEVNSPKSVSIVWFVGTGERHV